MKFHSIEIDTFGVLAGKQLEGLCDGLNVVYGPNGSGKTTLLQFLRGLFCGFADARRLKLLPADMSRTGGGAVSAYWEGDLCRFQRTGTVEADNLFRITRVRDGRQTAHPTFDTTSIPSNQIPLLYAVDRTNVHDLDGLIRMALQDGIELVSREAALNERADAAGVYSELAKRLDASRAQVDDLNGQRQQLRSEIEQLQARYEERCRRANAERLARAAQQSASCRQRIDWLHAELQAAESDLREAEERSWESGCRTSSMRNFRVTAEQRSRRVPSTDHLAGDQRKELDEIDVGVNAVRQRLAEIAKARLKISLRAAQIAGSPSMPTEEFLDHLRRSLSLMEDSLLELRDSAAHQNGRHPVVKPGASWPSASQAVVDELRRRLYGTCEHVSRYEIQYVKERLDAEAARLDEEEHSQLETLRSLQHRRQELLQCTGAFPNSWGTSQRSVEQQFCQCAEHDFSDEPRSAAGAPWAATAESHPVAEESPSWPHPEELARLRNRRERLSADLDHARNAWRTVRRNAERFDFPPDVVQLRQDIERRRFELNRLEQELSLAQTEWKACWEAAERNRRDAEQAAELRRPRCLKLTGTFLSRLTAGHYGDVHITAEHHELSVIDEHGTAWAKASLSRGTLDQVALSLRLALVSEYGARGIRFPLVLDDVLVDCDVDRLHEAVWLLKEFADEHDQQIIYLTCGTHLVGLFAAADAAVHAMPGATVKLPEQNPLREPPARWSVQGWIDRRFRARQASPDARHVEREKAAEPPATPRYDDRPTQTRFPASTSDPPIESSTDANVEQASLPFYRRQPGGPYWLSMDSPLVLVPSIGEQMGRRLTALGIRTAGDLLDLTAEESSIPLKSLQVDIGRLREWQAEALLLSCVPDLAGPDAQLLVACGVRDPHQLAECDLSQLIDRLDRLARRNRDAHIRAEQPTRSELQRWIQNARRSRSVEAARRESRRRRNQHESSESRRAIPAPFPASNRPAIADESEPRNFCLSPQSPVVDAPSIGPRMASRLEKLGVVSVGDLLARDPAELAERLKHRRVKAETVATWQQQARLMCRIPQLRGHDAQVLVACDITEPEQVARLDARTLFSIVGPFVATKEGQRLLRSSKTPDLQEVADWINWANHARPLKAA